MEMGKVVEAVWAVVGSVVRALSNAVETRKAETLAAAEAAEAEAAAAARILLKQYPEPFLLSLPSPSKRWAAAFWAAGGAIIQLPPGLQAMAEPPRLCQEFQRGECRRGDDCPFRHVTLSANEEEHGGRNAAAQRTGAPAVETSAITRVLSPRGTVALAAAAASSRSQSSPAATPVPRGVVSTPPPPTKEPPPGREWQPVSEPPKAKSMIAGPPKVNSTLAGVPFKANPAKAMGGPGESPRVVRSPQAPQRPQGNGS